MKFWSKVANQVPGTPAMSLIFQLVEIGFILVRVVIISLRETSERMGTICWIGSMSSLNVVSQGPA